MTPKTWTLYEDPARLRVLVSGYQSWSEAELRPLLERQVAPLLHSRIEQAHDPEWPPTGELAHWRSHTMLALVREDGSGWVGMDPDARLHFARWEVKVANDAVLVSLSAEGYEDTVRFKEVRDVATALDALTKEAGECMAARRAEAPGVWCSWYTYWTRVTAAQVLADARAIREAQLPIEVIQLDDGFQSDIGDWELIREGFGIHPRELATQLSEMGFTPGIWLAPLLVKPSSQLTGRHPEWFLQRAGASALYGDNWGGPYYALDATQEPVLRWLRDLAAMVREWGFSYLKLDFLFAGALPGERADPSCSRAQTYRAALEALREGAGADAYLLGCGAPLAQSVGIFDAMRTGPDVAPRWDDALRRQTLRDRSGPATRNAVQTCLARWWMHHWYVPDPDVYIGRREQSLLTDAERRTLAGLLDTIGGIKSFSDPLELLDAEGLEAVRSCIRRTIPDKPMPLDQQQGSGTVTNFQRLSFFHLDFPVQPLSPEVRPDPAREV